MIGAWLGGGKVDKGESPIQAVVREVKEESGIDLEPSKLRVVFTREDGEFFVITYFYDAPITQEPKQGDAGPVAWVTWEQLISGCFGEYNKRLKNKLGL